MILFKFEFFQEKITILLRLKATQNVKFSFFNHIYNYMSYRVLVSCFTFCFFGRFGEDEFTHNKERFVHKEPRVVKYPSGHQVIIINYSLMIT